jgi:hypothetical protein
MAKTGLVEFKEVVADFRDLGALAVKGAVAVPLIDVWLKIGPPPAQAIAGLASLIEVIAAAWVFQFGFNREEERLRLWMKAALAVFVLCLVSSLALLQRFTVMPGQGRERVVEGFWLRPDVKPLINDSYTPEQALRESEFEPSKVWTSGSIAVLRTGLTVMWLATYASFAVYLTTFVILQRRSRHGSHESGAE